MTQSRKSPRVRIVAWLLGLGLAVFCLCLWTSTNLFEQMLGPPSVSLGEAYQGKGGQGFDHGDLDVVLADIVDAEGLVRYERASLRRGEIEAYLQRLSKGDFGVLSRDAKLAFLINAYNAATLLLILENLPLASIRDIPAAQRWDAKRWDLLGHKLSLSELEHGYLRERFSEPRIHFAINCASVGCPPLRSEAYTGERIDAQLEDQARRMHAHPRWFSFEEDRLRLSRLYLWYRGDFLQQAPSVAAFAARWSKPLREALSRGESPSVEFLPYDWALNQAR